MAKRSRDRRPQRQPQQGLLYQPVTPDFTGIGDDVDQIANQLYQYQREKEIRKQERRDMMMQRFTQMTGKIERPDAVHQNIQKELDKRYNKLLGELTSKVAPDIEGDEQDWEAFQKGQRMIGEYYSDISEPLSWEKQWQRDYKMVIEGDSENWSEETIKGIKSYRGNKPPHEAYTLRKRVIPFGQKVNEMKEEMDEGGVSIFNAVETNSKGEIESIKTKEKFKERFYQTDENGNLKYNENGKPMLHEGNVKQIFRRKISKNKENQRGLMYELKRDGKKFDEEGSIYEYNGNLYGITPKRQTENGRKINNLTDFAFDKYAREVFTVERVSDRTQQVREEEGGGGGDLTQKEIEQRHEIAEDQAPVTIGKVKFDKFVGLGQRNLSSKAYFGEVTDPKSGKTDNLDMNRDYQVIGINPYSKKMAVSIDGQGLKRSPMGKKLKNQEEFSSYLKAEGLTASPDIKNSKIVIVDASKPQYRSLLEQEKFIDKNTGELIFSGGSYAPKKEEDKQQQEENTEQQDQEWGW